jgi:hypothetical protein
MDISKNLVAPSAVGDVVSTPFDLCDLIAGRLRRLRRSRGVCNISNRRCWSAQRVGTTENSALFPLTSP